MPVTSLNRSKIGNGNPGKIFNLLINKWSENVGVDIKKQIRDWDIKNKFKDKVQLLLHMSLNKVINT